MTKAVGVIILLISGVLGGLTISEKYHQRIKFLKQYIDFLIFLKNEIRYSQKPIFEILQNYHIQDPLKCCLNNFLLNLKHYSISTAWKNALYDYSSFISSDIFKNEKDVILNLGETLGLSDVEGQMTSLEYNLEIAKTYLNDAIEIQKSREKLPIVFGIGISLFVALLFI